MTAVPQAIPTLPAARLAELFTYVPDLGILLVGSRTLVKSNFIVYEDYNLYRTKIIKDGTYNNIFYFTKLALQMYVESETNSDVESAQKWNQNVMQTYLSRFISKSRRNGDTYNRLKQKHTRQNLSAALHIGERDSVATQSHPHCHKKNEFITPQKSTDMNLATFPKFQIFRPMQN